MYHAHFGIEESPFSITPDPRYLFMSRGHQEALAHLLYGVSESGGFVLLTGEVGTGKTSVCRALLEQLPDLADVALVINPRLSEVELVANICDELGVPGSSDGATLKSLIDKLNRHLLALHARGRHAVVIIDEAQNLSPAVLEQVRLLTNLETPTRKLLQIILVGQPELSEILETREMRQLAQRVTARYHLKPLSRAESKAYVRHRLLVGGLPNDMFSDRAIATLYRRSHGVPRLINSIGDRCLLGAYAQNLHRVDRRLAVQAAGEVLGEARPASSRRLAWIGSLGLLGSAAAAVIAGLILTGRFDPAAMAVDLPGAWNNSRLAGVFSLPSPEQESPDEGAVSAVVEVAKAVAGEDAVPLDKSVVNGASASADSGASVASDAIAAGFGDQTAVARSDLAVDISHSRLAAEIGAMPGLREPIDWPDGPAEGRLAYYVAEPILVPEAGPLTAPEPVDLADLLDSLDPVASRRAAVSTLFDLWRAEARGDLEDVCQAATASEVRCITGSGGLKALETLDRPALIALGAPGSGEISAVVVELADGRVTLLLGEERLDVDRAGLAAAWRGDYVALWRPPPVYNRVLALGARGADVAWVRNRLAALAGRDETVVGEAVFDDELHQDVIAFQKRRNLVADGIVGERTLIQLNTGLSDAAAPRLSGTGT